MYETNIVILAIISAQQQRSIHSHPLVTRAEEKGGDSVMGHGIMECGPDMGHGPTLHPQESLEAPGAKMKRATFHQGHKEPPAPSPPRAIASLSVRVLGQPDRQGLPPAIPRTHEKEGTAPSEPGSAHPVLHLSRSAGVSAGSHANEDSDEDDSDDDESEDDEDWGPGPGGARRGNRAPPQPQKMPLSVPSTFARSKRKLQPPQHIPPPQAHHSPMQLRHPTPPPSPPPDLFPLPDTPKQSPPDTDDQEGEGPEARGPRVAPFPPPTMQRQDSDSSSRSSSPEPPVKRRPGPLSLLVHKMESERAFRAVEASSAVDLSGEMVHSNAGPSSSSKSPMQKFERKSLQENQDMEEGRRLKEKKEREQHQEKEKERRKIEEQEREKKCLEEEKERERKRLEEEEKLRQKEEQEKERKRQEEEKERERKRQEEEKAKERKRQEVEKDKERQHQDEEKRREEKLQKEKYKREETASKNKLAVTEAQDSDSSSDSDSKSDSSSRSSQSSSSSSSSRDKTRPAKQLKVSYQTDVG